MTLRANNAKTRVIPSRADDEGPPAYATCHANHITHFSVANCVFARSLTSVRDDRPKNQ